MGFDCRDKAKQYSPQDGDTLEEIAKRESAEGNPLSEKDLARFNWGTDDPDLIDELLRDELGAYRRGEDKRYRISADVEPTGELLIPVAFKKEGFSTEKAHTLRVRKRPPPPRQFQKCVSVPGVTFGFDKSFVRPTVVDSLRPLEEALKENPRAKVLVFGHTDKVGSEDYNKGLSERRARSVYAFITNRPELWEDLYQEENWGIAVVQEILKDLGYDPGAADGVDGPRTRAAVEAFQRDQGLAADGAAGPQTRKKLFAAYMSGKHDVEIADDRFLDPKHMGCGEFNPIVETEEKCEENRRVTFYLFHEARPPRPPCKHGDLAPCRRQMRPPLVRNKREFRCSFYDSIARRCGCEGGGQGLSEEGTAWIGLQPLFQDALPNDALIRVESSDGQVYESPISQGSDRGDGLWHFEVRNPKPGQTYRVTLDVHRRSGPVTLFEGYELHRLMQWAVTGEGPPPYAAIREESLWCEDDTPDPDGDTVLEEPYESDTDPPWIPPPPR